MKCIQYHVARLWINYILYICSKWMKTKCRINECQRKYVTVTFIFSSLPAMQLFTVFNAQKQKQTSEVQQKTFSSGRSHNCIFIHNTDHNIISTQYTVLSVFFRTAISPRGNDWLLVAKILQSSGEYSYPGFWWRMHQQWHVLMRQTSKIQVWNTLPLLSVTSFPLMSNAPPWSRRFCWYLSSHLL